MKRSRIKAARGECSADLVLKNGNILNVFTEEIVKADVAIVGDTIVGIGNYRGNREIDCTGKYLTPGLIDGHLHIESSMISPLEFAKFILKKGTTTMIVDPHEIVNVSGSRGMDYILDATEDIPVNTFVMVPSSVPSSDVEINGAGKFLAEEMKRYREHKRVLGFGEMMRFMDVIDEQEETMDKIRAFEDMIMDGHAPGLSGKDVQAYRTAGICNDHECAGKEEMLEKLRAGFYILIREGSGARNLGTLVTVLRDCQLPLEQCMFCTDDKHLEDIEREGHINHCVRKAVKLGIPVAKAYKMASYYAARAYGLKNLGAIGPGYRADILIMDDLKEVNPKIVIKGGQVADEQWLSSFSYKIKDETLLRTVICDALTVQKLSHKKMIEDHVIEMVPHQLLTICRLEEIPGEHGIFCPNEEYTKLCVVERHGKTGHVGICPLKGYGIRNGAVATSVSHDSHNIIAAGDNDADLIAAVEELRRIQGGYVIASEGKVAAFLPLEIAGLMSLDTAEHVQKKVQEMVALARKLGVPETLDPFITLSFLALTVIPDIRLTENGLYDVNDRHFLQVFSDELC
ncbi:Adenine deaminase [uncultured Roseburia sp.]|uniref:Adenine deaminase n=1 Tax=Brotonthovivens ammoniilytica TaxID=2981725 RepID=A0ABT2TG10_9FIRM|nr:adenine deaminase [Brotonthovivens ammoniilytica]MCU6761115.1 adenine deaminase [Brotonthovivens ammoniilytica]SCI19336.1 Adenine deaminase [uncultured Roseburia sp.]